mmetsp:Transcript_59562/g.192724  ORF Transcript_59562/g.192724 Transcript_59562/m.192724 type:complete len:204 (-) Transcript_59562:27-638(-)
MGMALLVFGPMGVATFELGEEGEEEDREEEKRPAEEQDSEAAQLAAGLSEGFWKARRAAAQALGDLGQRAVAHVSDLERASREDEDEDVREAANEALVKVAKAVGRTEQQLVQQAQLAQQAAEQMPGQLLRSRWSHSAALSAMAAKWALDPGGGSSSVVSRPSTLGPRRGSMNRHGTSNALGFSKEKTEPSSALQQSVTVKFC